MTGMAVFCAVGGMDAVQKGEAGQARRGRRPWIDLVVSSDRCRRDNRTNRDGLSSELACAELHPLPPAYAEKEVSVRAEGLPMGGELGECRAHGKGGCNPRCCPRCNGGAHCPGNGRAH